MRATFKFSSISKLQWRSPAFLLELAPPSKVTHFQPAKTVPVEGSLRVESWPPTLWVHRIRPRCAPQGWRSPDVSETCRHMSQPPGCRSLRSQCRYRNLSRRQTPQTHDASRLFLWIRAHLIWILSQHAHLGSICLLATDIEENSFPGTLPNYLLFVEGS